jgi:hypothetical protein
MADYRIRPILLALVGSVALGGCSTYDDYGYGRGYSGVSIGYGSGGYYGSSPYYGWYDGCYYPGTGYYVYDSNRRRYSWNAAQRRYWEARRDRREDRRELRENWAEFRQDRRGDRRDYRAERRDDRRDLRRGEVSRPAFRADRRDDRQDFRRERRTDRREVRRENRRDRRD